MVKIPEDRFYSEHHLWVKKETFPDTGIGLTEYFAWKNTEILDIDLPAEEEEFEKDEIFGSVETVEELYDLPMPVSGKVVAVNEKVLEDVEILNEDPYDEGWLIKVELTNPEELEELLPAEDYEMSFVEEIEEDLEDKFLEEEE